MVEGRFKKDIINGKKGGRKKPARSIIHLIGSVANPISFSSTKFDITYLFAQ
ncbi:hypothetical protein GTCCBUS3UF5_14760 [Geobacillus thermoleovorans CCB_US3_UF5]|uniref:Transposase n=1 Tax=Geobacillus thermoleovorans CCB_US3_UF5 TaxID=1111068 RepID=A0ABM5MGN6_GEOTH|nr:hypothetical protein GTCCBUS3UF5_14760 [Geobacillus thermoleovorans CCB_US3_UF5]